MHVFGVIITVLVTVSEREPFTDIVQNIAAELNIGAYVCSYAKFQSLLELGPPAMILCLS